MALTPLDEFSAQALVAAAEAQKEKCPGCWVVWFVAEFGVVEHAPDCLVPLAHACAEAARG